MMKEKLLLLAVYLLTFQAMYANKPAPSNWTEGGSDFSTTAYDISWFEDSESSYTISSNSQLGGLAKLANDGTTDFSGKTIVLGGDVDMEKYNWVSVAEFKGVFDGGGYTIANLKTNDTSNGLFALVTGGEVKNVIVSGAAKETTGNKIVGGIIGKLVNGLLKNAAYVGTVEASEAEVSAGGLVGVNEGGTISHSYFAGTATINEEADWGNITSANTGGTVNNSYFLPNEAPAVGIGTGTGTNVEAKDADAFSSGEVAWLLNQENGVNTELWGQAGDLPGFAAGDTKPIYKVKYPELANATIIGQEYAVEGAEIEFTLDIEDGYMFSELSIEGVEIENYSRFVMPARDIDVVCTIVPIPATIVAFPAKDITDASFVASWNEVPGATDYLITVKEGNTVVEGYNAFSTGLVTNMEITGLLPNTAYTFSLQSVEGETVSSASNEISVQLGNIKITSSNVEKYLFTANWPAYVGAQQYRVSLLKNDVAVDGYENVITTDNFYEFTNLSAGTTYACKVDILRGESVIENTPVSLATNMDYGAQLNNSNFELWEGEGDEEEPVDWNSFMSGGGSLIGMAKTVHMEKSTTTRPGSDGSLSTRIWTKSVAGIALANGNLTCGQIIAGSTSPTNPGNHNITRREYPEFSEPIYGARPDSLSVWVKYNPTDKENDQARIAATIHDDYDYRDPSGSDEDAPNHVVAKAVLNYSATEDSGWQRISIPFDYEAGPAESADYMLVTFTSNKTPGAGTDNDEVFIDDMVLIYNPELTMDTPAKTTFAQGESISVVYTVEGTMSPSNLIEARNVVSLQLSDANGSFDNPTILAQLTTDYSGVLAAELPDDISGNYSIRVSTTNYPMNTEPVQITIQEVPAATVALDATAVGDYGFTANWQTAANATDYLLTVKTNDVVVAGYDKLATGNVLTYEVTGLTPNTLYTYTVAVKAGELLSEDSNEVTVQTTNAVDIDLISGGIAVYPNPADNYLQVTGVGQGTVYQITDISGKLVSSATLNAGKINVSTLVSGVYFIEIAGNKVKFIKK